MKQGRQQSEPNPFPSMQTSNPAMSKLHNPSGLEGVGSPVGIESQRVKTPPVTIESDEGKVFVNLTSTVNQPRVGEKRSNPYSVSSLMANDEQRTKRSEHEQLKFSALLQEMSQGRRPEHLVNLQPTDASAQFMDLNNTRNQLSSSLIRQSQTERGAGLGTSGESQAQSMGATYPKPAQGIQSPLNCPTGISSLMNMRSSGNMLNQERTGFNPRTMYPGYPSHGEFQRQQMMLLQQQQQQRQMMQRENYHMAGSMMANGIPRNMPPEYAYYTQRPMFGAMMEQYKNGTRPPTIDGKLETRLERARNMDLYNTRARKKANTMQFGQFLINHLFKLNTERL